MNIKKLLAGIKIPSRYERYRWDGFLTNYQCWRWDRLESRGEWVHNNGEIHSSMMTLKNIKRKVGLVLIK